MFEENNGKRKVSIPCPDNIPGCAVAHYKWVSTEENTELPESEQIARLQDLNDDMIKMIEKTRKSSVGSWDFNLDVLEMIAKEMRHVLMKKESL